MIPRIMVLTGEVSGDMHAAGVIHALRRHYPDLECYGTGGDALRSAGADILFDVETMAVVGGTEALAKLLRLRRIFYALLKHVRAHPPDVLLLVDYPGFNLRFAQRAHALGIRTVFYICPQVWAWRRARIPKMAACLDRLITIFPFEPALFEQTGLQTDFAGHPLVDETRRLRDQPAPDLPWGDGRPRIALLPGSRSEEIKRLLPVFRQAAARFEARFPQSCFILAAVNAAGAESLAAALKKLPGKGPKNLRIVAGQTRHVLCQADAAVVASGTATLEAAFMDCPTIVAYRTGHLTFALGRRLVKLRHIGIVNILADREICPEFLQGDCRPDRIVEALATLAIESPERRRMKHAMRAVVANLGDGQAYEKAADIVADELVATRAATG